MTPPKQIGNVTWDMVAKVLLSCIGAILTVALAIAAKAAERQAEAFDRLKDAVYNGQAKDAVMESEIKNIKADNDVTKDRVSRIEASIFKEKK